MPHSWGVNLSRLLAGPGLVFVGHTAQVPPGHQLRDVDCRAVSSAPVPPLSLSSLPTRPLTRCPGSLSWTSSPGKWQASWYFTPHWSEVKDTRWESRWAPAEIWHSGFKWANPQIVESQRSGQNMSDSPWTQLRIFDLPNSFIQKYVFRRWLR